MEVSKEKKKKQKRIAEIKQEFKKTNKYKHYLLKLLVHRTMMVLHYALRHTRANR